MDKYQKLNNEKKTHGLKYIDIMCVCFIYVYIHIWKREERDLKICPGMKINKMGIMITLEKKI